MKKSLYKYLLNIGLVLLTSLLVYFLVLKGQEETIIESLRNISFKSFIVLAGIVLLWQIIISMILVCYARIYKKDYSFKEGFINSLVACLFNGITPSSSGGQFAQLYVFSKQGVRSGDGASILWMDFIIYQMVLCIYGFIMIFSRFNEYYNRFSSLFIFVIIGFIVDIFVIFFLYALGKSERFLKWVTSVGLNIAHKLHFVDNIEETKKTINDTVIKFVSEANALKKRKNVIINATLLTILRLTAYYSIPFVVFINLGVKPTLSLYLDCLTIGSFVAISSSMIPIPGASGGTEVIFMSMFASLFNPILTKTAMLLWRVFSYYLLLLVGAFAFACVKIKN